MLDFHTMPRCSYKIPSTQKFCKHNAINDSCYCTIHNKKVNGVKDDDRDDDEIQLALPPQEVKGNAFDQDIDMKHAHDDVVVPPKKPSQKEWAQKELPLVVYEDIKKIQNDYSITNQNLVKLTKLLEQLSINVNTNNTNPKPPRVVRPPSEAAIRRKAMFMHYNDFKTKPGMVESIKELMVNGRVIKADGRVPWLNVKYIADEYFMNNIDDTTRQMYLDSAQTMLINKRANNL